MTVFRVERLLKLIDTLSEEVYTCGRALKPLTMVRCKLCPLASVGVAQRARTAQPIARRDHRQAEAGLDQAECVGGTVFLRTLTSVKDTFFASMFGGERINLPVLARFSCCAR